MSKINIIEQSKRLGALEELKKLQKLNDTQIFFHYYETYEKLKEFLEKRIKKLEE